jgi:hypothetical protein
MAGRGGSLVVLRMHPDAYRQILMATMAGGLAGVLVMWHRKQSQAGRRSRLRKLVVVVLGTAASACALIAFTKALGAQSPLYAATVMILITGWTAVLNSVLPLSVPPFARRVRACEFTVLRDRWTGVRLFGAVLRATPLRHLGGRVFLSQVGRNPLAVLGDIREAQAVHIWALLFTCPWLLFWAMQQQWMSLVCGLAVHTPLNVYPILHLRYVTWRLQKCAARMRCRDPAEQTGCTERRNAQKGDHDEK